LDSDCPAPCANAAGVWQTRKLNNMARMKFSANFDFSIFEFMVFKRTLPQLDHLASNADSK
jgi:hypothetical protein